MFEEIFLLNLLDVLDNYLSACDDTHASSSLISTLLYKTGTDICRNNAKLWPQQMSNCQAAEIYIQSSPITTSHTL